MHFARHNRSTWIVALAALAGCGFQPPGNGERDIHLGGDLIAARGELVLSDSVQGDVIVAGGRIEFSGSAGGDFLGAGGQQTIGGRIGGDVRAAGGQVEVDATVTHNATVAGGDVRLAPNGTIGRNAYLTGGSVRVDGTIERALTASGGEVVLNGTVGSDVVVNTERLRIGPTANIGGDLRYRVPDGNATIDPGASIAGQTVALEPPTDRGILPGLFRLIWMTGFLVAAAVAILLFPGTSTGATEILGGRTAAALGFGLIWLLVVPVAAAIVAISVVGLPLALITLALWCISLYLAAAMPSLWLGQRFLRDRIPTGRGGLLLAFLAGAIVLLIVSIIPILGTLVMIAAALLGAGALVLTVARGPEPA